MDHRQPAVVPRGQGPPERDEWHTTIEQSSATTVSIRCAIRLRVDRAGRQKPTLARVLTLQSDRIRGIVTVVGHVWRPLLAIPESHLMSTNGRRASWTGRYVWRAGPCCRRRDNVAHDPTLGAARTWTVNVIGTGFSAFSIKLSVAVSMTDGEHRSNRGISRHRCAVLR